MIELSLNQINVVTQHLIDTGQQTVSIDRTNLENTVAAHFNGFVLIINERGDAHMFTKEF